MTYLEEFLAKKKLGVSLAGPFARAKNRHGRWVFGSYLTHLNRTPSPIGDSLSDDDVRFLIVQDGFSDWNMPRDIEGVEVDPTTVCLNSFAKDIDCRSIFEGDILFFEPNKYKGVVCFGTYTPTGYQQEDTAQGFYISWTTEGHIGMAKYLRNDLIYWASQCKVVGTIFDKEEKK